MIQNNTAHTYTDHWHLGYESCYALNYSIRTCSCGYSYTYRKSHPGKRGPIATGRNIHVWTCTSCGQWLENKACVDENGNTLSCANPGTCSVCGYTYTTNHHRISGGTCIWCKKQIAKYSNPTITYASDYSYATVMFTVTILIDGARQTTPSFYCGDANASQSWTVTQNGNVFTCTGKFTFNGKPISSYYSLDCSSININGLQVRTEGYGFGLRQDITAPVISEIKQTDQTSSNGWATIKRLDISGTEDFSTIINITITDKSAGKVMVNNAAVNVSDYKWAYTCTPPLEADENGRVYTIKVVDQLGNASTKDFIVYKTDGTAPQVESSLSYTEWTAKAKTITLIITDYGSGSPQTSLGDQTHYQVCTKTADGKYQITYTFSDDIIGTKNYDLYLKDALGNATKVTLTVGNIDKKTYTIIYDLDSGTASGLKTTYTVENTFTLPTPQKVGYTFLGYVGSNGSDPQKTVTVNKGTRGNLNYTAKWQANTYDDYIGHWASGFKNQEGNNGEPSGNTAFKIGGTSFSTLYGNEFTLNIDRAKAIPNGYNLRSTFRTLNINDTWNNYAMGTKVTQRAQFMGFEYWYDPITYTITYNLNGGTNNSANPSTYNVLYGVSLQNPVREGFSFDYWSDENGNRVTGINEGCNATFSSADDLYTKLAARTTGNRTFTAHWRYNPISVKVPQVLTGNKSGGSSFRIKCDDIKAGNIKVDVPNNFMYKQNGKTDVAAIITKKSGSNIITPSNKSVVYNISTDGLSAGSWSGSFNIDLTLTKE